MKKEVISKTVDEAIKRSYAKLAKKHFQFAENGVGSLSDQSNPGLESDRRMAIVERYLKEAGAHATKSYF